MSKADDVASFVGRKIYEIERDIDSSRPVLARLRRCAGKDVSESQEVWDIVLENMPESMMGKGTDGFEPSESEIAVHTTMTLYSIQQQGKSESVNGKMPFAEAVGRIGRTSNAVVPGVKRRFDAVLSSSDINELSNHLRGLVQLIRQSDKPLRIDYMLLSRDLYQFQFPDGRRRVLMRWGQEFYALRNDLEE